MTGRVRWETGPSGNLLGRVGTLPFWSFQILQSGDPAEGFKLFPQLPGLASVIARSVDVDELKAEAEGWLEEFVTSLGAVFPDVSEALPRAPLVHDLAIVLRGVLHPDAQVGPPARLASRRLAEVLGIADGEVNTWNVQARLREAFGVVPDEPAKPYAFTRDELIRALRRRKSLAPADGPLVVLEGDAALAALADSIIEALDAPAKKGD